MGTMKTCKCCGKEKELHEFAKEKRNKDGYGARCKKCETKRCNAIQYPKVMGLRLPRGKALAATKRQDMIVKYGIAVVEAMDLIDDC